MATKEYHRGVQMHPEGLATDRSTGIFGLRSEGFNMTELGPLPEEWRVVRLEQVATIRYGKARPKETGGIPVVGSGGVYAWTKRALVDFPTLVIGRKGTAGTVWLQEQPCWPSDTTFYLEWKTEALDHRFVYHFLQVRPLSGEHAKTTLPSLQRPDLENYLLPLPPLPEQRAIARVLRTVQRAKKATERVIAALKELKKSLMRHLFTYGSVPLDQADQVPLKETEIGPVPKDWKVMRLGEVTEKPQYGYTTSATKKPMGPKFLRITDIHDDRVDWPAVPFCTIESHLLEKYRLQKGDILFARIGATTGKTYLVGECPQAVFASYLIRVRTDTRHLLPEYLYFFAHTSQYWQQINAAKGGRLKQGINIPILISLCVPLPPIDEQHEIARILQTVDRKIEAEENRKATLEALFKTLLHHLMTGKLHVTPNIGEEAS